MANWYAYNGVGDPTVPASYTKLTIKPTCLNGAQICAIYLEDSTTIPTTPFDQRRLDYISDGLVSMVQQPGTGKKFVYLKCSC